MDSKQKYIEFYQQIADLCEQEGWGDPFSYARSKEIYAACVLGHKVAKNLSGADAINEKGQEVEYKSTIDSRVKGSYTGISVQLTWEEQKKYLFEDKIAKYVEHFFNRFEDGKLVEAWKLTGEQVYNILLPKMKRSFESRGKRKDPRVGAAVCNTEIKKYGTRVI